nr:hypothetical protein [Agrobacterium sp. rho-8.1]
MSTCLQQTKNDNELFPNYDFVMASNARLKEEEERLRINPLVQLATTYKRIDYQEKTGRNAKVPFFVISSSDLKWIRALVTTLLKIYRNQGCLELVSIIGSTASVRDRFGRPQPWLNFLSGLNAKLSKANNDITGSQAKHLVDFLEIVSLSNGALNGIYNIDFRRIGQ